MNYNNLGKAGIKVSELSFGSWLTFGTAVDVSRATELMKLAVDNGVNFFDNAEVYAGGKSEEVMGAVLKQFRRESLVISTKIFWGGDGPNDKGLSWKHLVEGTKSSLRRLKLDYVDLLFCHRPDPSTPIEETVRAMDSLIRSGVAFYWGTSEWSADAIESAYQLADQHHCVPPSMEQPQYNLFVRERVEREYRPLYEKRGLGTTIWSPLASGLLTGKYNNGVPAGSRLAENSWLGERITKDKLDAVKKLASVAAELDCTLAQLAIAWCLKNPDVSTVILGATSSKQLLENLGAVRVKEKLSEPVLARIREAVAAVPNGS